MVWLPVMFVSVMDELICHWNFHIPMSNTNVIILKLIHSFSLSHAQTPYSVYPDYSFLYFIPISEFLRVPVNGHCTFMIVWLWCLSLSYSIITYLLPLVSSSSSSLPPCWKMWYINPIIIIYYNLSYTQTCTQVYKSLFTHLCESSYSYLHFCSLKSAV